MQQLHCFDELRNNQVVIHNHSAKIKRTIESLYLPASSFTFRILRLAKKNGANINRVFGRSDGGQDDQNKRFFWYSKVDMDFRYM
jgi:hypothetical protein